MQINKYLLKLINVEAMVNVRCTNFDDSLWHYVVENARLRGVSRCEALELIVKEHIQFFAEAQREWMERRENVEEERLG